MSLTSITALCAGLSILAPWNALAAEPSSDAFPFESARASTFFTAVAARFDDGTTGFTTCSAVLLNVKKGYLAVPLQCVGQAEQVACRSSLDVPLERQLLPADFRRWLAEKSTCGVVRRFPEYDLVLLRAGLPLTPKATAAKPREGAVSIGERVWSVGFPEQLPSLLTQGTVAAVLSRVHIDNMPPEFNARLMGISGAISEGSAGAGVFDGGGQLLGIVVADARYFDGGFAVLASTLRKLAD